MKIPIPTRKDASFCISLHHKTGHRMNKCVKLHSLFILIQEENVLQLRCINQFLHFLLNEMAEVRNLADANTSSIIQLQIIKDNNR